MSLTYRKRKDNNVVIIYSSINVLSRKPRAPTTISACALLHPGWWSLCQTTSSSVYLLLTSEGNLEDKSSLDISLSRGLLICNCSLAMPVIHTFNWLLFSFDYTILILLSSLLWSICVCYSSGCCTDIFRVNDCIQLQFRDSRWLDLNICFQVKNMKFNKF